MTRILSYISLLIFLNQPIKVIAQEILSGLEINPHVKERFAEAPFLKKHGTGMLDIPFFDDFSGTSVYPDSEKWSDRYAFINSSYPVNPISLNVATLDAIDHTGTLYEYASTFPFLADQLTSRPIDLSYNEQDSIYLSFFYQPQGRGDKPQTQDSLRLEFYSPGRETWKLVWSVPGSSLHDFKLVMIPVKDSIFLQKGFRFRFSNIASIADNPANPGSMGNSDHWNIDYVYLEKNRTYSDTVFRDVAFIKPPGSLLNNYHEMPWEQFLSGRLAEMSSVLPFTFRNNDAESRSVSKMFQITNIYESTSPQLFSGGSSIIQAGKIETRNIDLTYTFNAETTDSALFRIKAWLETDAFDYKGNDTVVQYQNFGNYFALDDGTAENGYGLYGGGTENARIACRFRSYKPDSLRAINIYFNRSLNNASRQYFNLAVWDDNNGKPGNLLYIQEGEIPEYEEELNRFHTYHLDSAVFITGVFYVGIIQTTSEFLNIGFDVNRNNRSRIFYNILGEWVNTSFEGSLMIRPVTGRTTSTPTSISPVTFKELKVFPNPVSDVLFIETDPAIDRGSLTYDLYNSLGQTVFQGTGHITAIDVSPYPPGVYFLRARGRDTGFKLRKIVIKQ